MTYLNIPFEQFLDAYNNYLFIPSVSTMGDKVVLEYLSWSNATKLLNQFFPELVVEFERDDNGSFVYKIENSLVTEARENFSTLLAEKQEQIKNITDWKLKNKLEEELQLLLYDNRGFYVLPYLVDKETGLRTPSLFFPVMDNKNNAIYNPDARDINDTKARGGVKTISLYTGLGLRLFTREDIDINGKKGLIKDCPKWKAIQYIIETTEFLGREVDMSVVHLGRSLKELKKIADELYSEAYPE